MGSGEYGSETMTLQEETEHTYIYDQEIVNGKQVKLYRLTQWSKNRVDNAVQKSDFDWFKSNDFSSLRQRVIFLEDVCKELAEGYIKAKIELKFSHGKKYRVSDISRMIEFPRHLFSIFHFIEELVAEGKLEAIEGGRYVKT